MNKIILKAVVFFALLVMAVPFTLNRLVGPLSHKAFGLFTQELTQSQIATVKIDFESARIKSWNRIEWKNFKVFLLFGDGENILSGKSLAIQSPVFVLEKKKNQRNLFSLRFDGAELAVYQPGTKEVSQQAHLRYAEVQTAFNPMNLPVFKKQIRFIVAEAKNFLFSGSTKMPIALSAASRFKVSNKPLSAELEVKESDGSYALVMSEEDLGRISSLMAEILTASEIRFISRHPLQAAKMLEIRDEASLAAKKMAQVDPHFPEDAYRHIYWSYLLTREFSEKMAEEMTSAHERGSSNSETDSQMDLNNNYLGRQYAVQGLSPDELLRKVFEDPAVIRSAIPEPLNKSEESDALIENSQPPIAALSVVETIALEPEGKIQARI